MLIKKNIWNSFLLLKKTFIMGFAQQRTSLNNKKGISSVEIHHIFWVCYEKKLDFRG